LSRRKLILSNTAKRGVRPHGSKLRINDVRRLPESLHIASHESGWRNPKHRQQWTNTLATYVSPVFGHLPVQSIDIGLVLNVLEALWTNKPETASRVRGRIEAILDWAKAREYRSGENPARWRGHLDHLLPAKSKARRVRHHAALPYKDIAAFTGELRDQSGMSARALEFLILTATRTSETLLATWSEIDFAERLWTIPETRMKVGLEHRVPLSDTAMVLLESMSPPTEEARQRDLVFPGTKQGRPLSEMSLLMLLRRMNRNVTVHGFRSTFKEWGMYHLS
jgi:integrase